MSITKNVLLNWYSSMKKKLRKIRMIFDIENWLSSQILALFDSSSLIQNSKFNNFLWICWFLFKNISNFVPPVWKLHNLYCHIRHEKFYSRENVLIILEVLHEMLQNGEFEVVFGIWSVPYSFRSQCPLWPVQNMICLE